MGIRCCCPNGHKLNVKAEQAGKIGICPVCKLRFQIPFRNAQTPIREKESRPSKRESPKDPYYIKPLPTLDSSHVSTNKSAGDPLDLDLEPLPGFEETNDSTSESKEDPLLKSLGLEELSNSEDSNTPTTSSVEQGPDSGSDAWYILGMGGREYGPVSTDVIRDWIKTRRLSDATIVWREGGPRQKAWLFPELNVEKDKSDKDRVGCGCWLCIIVSVIIDFILASVLGIGPEWAFLILLGIIGLVFAIISGLAGPATGPGGSRK